MSEKAIRHSLAFDTDILTVSGVVKVVEISEKQAQFKLTDSSLWVKGSGLNVIKLDKEQGLVQLETKSLSQLTYRQNTGIKGLFR